MTNIVAVFLIAITQVENTPHNPYGLTSAAIACVNRNYATSYTRADRRRPERAKEIVIRYLSIYHPKYGPFNPMTAGRIIYGGPRGPSKRCTRDYGQRVDNLVQAMLEGS